MMRFLYDIKCNAFQGVDIKVDKFQNLIGTACNEYLDFLPENYDISKHFSAVKDETDFPRLKRIDSETLDLTKKKSSPIKRQKSLESGDDFKGLARETISYTDIQCYEALKIEIDYRKKLHILNKLYSLHDENEKIPENDQGNTIKMGITNCFEIAKTVKDWSYIRFAAGLLGKVIDSLTPSISEILVKERILVIGSSGKRQFVVTDPLTPLDAYRKIYEYTIDEDPRDICLQQELIVNISNLLITDPELFMDIYKINIGWIIVAMQSLLAWGIPKQNFMENQLTSIYDLSPSEINKLLYITLSRSESKFMNLTLNILNHYQTRLIEGSLCVVPQNFYSSFWNILSRSEGVIIEKEFIPRLPTIYNMMPDEINFMIHVEVVISAIQEPVRRKLFMEMIGVIATLVERVPEINFSGKLDIGKLIDDSRTLYQKSEVEIINRISLSHSTPDKDKNLQFCRFEDLAPCLKAGTIFYMTKTTLDLLFSECNTKSAIYPECNIS